VFVTKLPKKASEPAFPKEGDGRRKADFPDSWFLVSAQRERFPEDMLSDSRHVFEIQHFWNGKTALNSLSFFVA
jgi:hypothetical protein